MSEITEKLNERGLHIEPIELWPAVVAFCRELFPTDIQLTCNDTRVEATFALGEDVTAQVIVDVDPWFRGGTRLNAMFRAYGTPLKQADRPLIKAMAQQLFDGLDGVVEGVLKQKRRSAPEHGIAS